MAAEPNPTQAWAATRREHEVIPPPPLPPGTVRPGDRARERIVLAGLILLGAGAGAIYWPAGLILPGLYLLVVTWPRRR